MSDYAITREAYERLAGQNVWVTSRRDPGLESFQAADGQDAAMRGRPNMYRVLNVNFVPGETTLHSEVDTSRAAEWQQQFKRAAASKDGRQHAMHLAIHQDKDDADELVDAMRSGKDAVTGQPMLVDDEKAKPGAEPDDGPRLKPKRYDGDTATPGPPPVAAQPTDFMAAVLARARVVCEAPGCTKDMDMLTYAKHKCLRCPNFRPMCSEDCSLKHQAAAHPT